MIPFEPEFVVGPLEQDGVEQDRSIARVRR
jgi:hypothetical protein